MTFDAPLALRITSAEMKKDKRSSTKCGLMKILQYRDVQL